MINTYDLKVSHPDMFKQLIVKDKLFVYYQCPQVNDYDNLFTHYNEIIYTLSGKKTLCHKDKSWTLTDDTSVFVKRTAYKQQLYQSIGWEVLAIYFQDDYLRQVFREFRQYLTIKNLPSPSPDMLSNINVNETTHACFYSMIPYFTQKIPPSDSLLDLKFRELLSNIFSDPANTNFLAYISSINDQHKTPIWQIIEAN